MEKWEEYEEQARSLPSSAEQLSNAAEPPSNAAELLSNVAELVQEGGSNFLNKHSRCRTFNKSAPFYNLDQKCKSRFKFKF